MNALGRTIRFTALLLLAIIIVVGVELLFVLLQSAFEKRNRRPVRPRGEVDSRVELYQPIAPPATGEPEPAFASSEEGFKPLMVRTQGTFDVVPNRVRVSAESVDGGLAVRIIRRNKAGEGQFGPAGTFVHDLKAPWFVYAESEFVFWMYNGVDSLVRYEVRPGSCVARDHGFTDVPDEVASRVPNKLLVAPGQLIEGLNVPVGAN